MAVWGKLRPDTDQWPPAPYNYPAVPVVETHLVGVVITYYYSPKPHVFSFLKVFEILLLGWMWAAELPQNWHQIPQQV